MESAKVSFVIAARNDDYGGDFNARLENSVQFLSHYVEQYQLPTEYLIVNYNPIADKPSLKELISWPENRKYLSIRIIDVPNEIHQELSNPEIRKTVPLYEYIAKNVGIRRASGEFICAANPDILIDPAIIKSFAEEGIDANAFYRVDRCDFNLKKRGANFNSPESYLEEVKRHVYRIFLKGNDYHIQPGSGLSRKLAWWRMINRIRNKIDINILPFEKFGAGYFWRIDHHNAEYFYHCNVSGDFMMMHKKHWEQLHGYPEKTYLSIHTDALGVIMAASSGLREYVFDQPVYHQDHARRYDARKIDEDESLRDAYLYFEEEALTMLRNKKPTIYNDETWGLANHDFKEVIF